MKSVNRIAVVTGLATAGLSFAAYPALRPYGPEEGAAGAADFGSTAWLVAHALGMLGFVALAFSLRIAATSLPWNWAGRPLREVEGSAWFAVAMILPYYGAEAYGLHALGGYATKNGDVGALDVANSFRYAPLAMTTFALGLLALIFVGARIAMGLWSAGPAARCGGLLAGLGLVTYLPQYFGTSGVRIAHGLVLGAGLVLMSLAAARQRPPAEPDLIQSAELGSIKK